MQIGVRWTGAMRQAPAEENIAWAAQHGFADVETDLTENLVPTLQRFGLTAWAANINRIRLITADDAQREAALAAATQAIDSAAGQGIKVLCCAHAMVQGRSPADQIVLFKEGFGPLAAHAEQAGVQLAFENFPARGRNLMQCPELWDAAFTAVPSPALGLTFDPSHLVVLHIDWLWALRAYRERILYCHAKDTELFLDRRNRYGIYGAFLESGGPASGNWWRYRLPGFGLVNWRKYGDVLAEIGYSGPLNIEHEDQVWGHPNDIPRVREGLLLAQRYLQQTLG